MLSSAAYDLVGTQTPRLFHLPTQVSSAGLAAVELAEVAGLSLDPWQKWCLEQLLAEREAQYFNPILNAFMPKSAAYEAALIVARQNGKGAILEALELAWLFLTGAMTILHSAHEFPTSLEHFQRIEGLISGCPELRAELARGGIKNSHGSESITLANGQRLIFKARTKGSARGFTIDKLVLDEAMILKDVAIKAMYFATSAAPDPQIILTGSAGDKDSVHFGRARSRGIKALKAILAGKDNPELRLFFAEWSAELCSILCPKDCDRHDDRSSPSTWAKVNPGLGIRLQMENVYSEFAGLSKEAFDVERLSVGDWPGEDEKWSVISEEGWMNCEDALSQAERPMTFAIDTTPDRRYSTIAVAASNGEGSIHIEVTGKDGKTDYRPGTSWVVERAIEINRKFSNSQWVIDKATQAGEFWDELEKAKLRLIAPTGREYAQSCGAFFESVMPISGSKPSIRHLNQPSLTAAVAGAEKRELAEMWAWDKKSSASDISPLVAATLAVWGHRKRLSKPRPVPSAAWV